MSAVTHLAGNDVTIDDRFLRQRCAWCGGMLVDCDLENADVAGDVPAPPRPNTWPVGALVRVDGDQAVVLDQLPDGAQLMVPADSCTQLDHMVTT